MARYYKLFVTKEERKQFEQEQKQANPTFRVCMRMTARQLEKDLYKEKGFYAPCEYATVYCFGSDDD